VILSATDIAERLRSPEADPLVITPRPDLAHIEQSGSASIDLRLGTWFEAPRQHAHALLDVFESEPGQKMTDRLTKTTYVPFGRRFILHPRSFVLAVTLEWLRLPGGLAGYVVGKSSWGRRGLIIATATGVHPRYTGCLTLELANVGAIPIAVYPGMEICQLFLHTVSHPVPYTEHSAFSCWRRPVLGALRPDDFARRLKEGAPTPKSSV
jgi:dCTP deaminase